MDDTDFSQVTAWRDEMTRSKDASEIHWADWDENIKYYKGKSPDAAAAVTDQSNYVNTNSDFTIAEVKKSQLFYETPELMVTAKGVFKEKPPTMPGAPVSTEPLPGDSIIAAHRELLNDFLGPAEANVLPTIHKAILDCLVPSGFGATKIGFSATQEQKPTPPDLGAKFMAVGQMPPPTVPMPVSEQWYWDRIPPKKLRVPADFADTDYDRAPFLAMRFRLPLSVARQVLDLPPDFDSSTTEEDKQLLQSESRKPKTSNVPYVEGEEIWYYASIFDEDVINPRVIRRHILVDNVDAFCEKPAPSNPTNPTNPYQELLPNGRLSADSMIGYPIHVLAIRSLPDDAYVPSDSSMIRPLVRELCTFRTQQVQERDANIPRILYDATKLLPEVIAKIQNGTVGSLIGVQADALQIGIDKIMAQVVQGTQTRGSYQANDYIQRDLDRTVGMDAIGSGVSGESGKTATEIGTMDKVRSIRLDHERRVILAWYLKGVQKFSALVCRFLTPQLAIPMLGPTAAQAWASWDKKTWDGRFVINARPDSQIKLDAASERKFALDLYQFLAKDPQVNRAKLLENLLVKAGMNPVDILQPPPQEKKPDPSIGFTFKGEDFLGPQADQVREILAQCGIQVSQQAVNASASQLLQSMKSGIRDANGKAVPAVTSTAQHGGVSDKVRPLDQQSADQTGQRSGQKPQVK